MWTLIPEFVPADHARVTSEREDGGVKLLAASAALHPVQTIPGGAPTGVDVSREGRTVLAAR
jgi:hypothetical protein